MADTQIEEPVVESGTTAEVPEAVAEAAAEEVAVPADTPCETPTEAAATEELVTT